MNDYLINFFIVLGILSFTFIITAIVHNLYKYRIKYLEKHIALLENK